MGPRLGQSYYFWVDPLVHNPLIVDGKSPLPDKLILYEKQMDLPLDKTVQFFNGSLTIFGGSVGGVVLPQPFFSPGHMPPFLNRCSDHADQLGCSGNHETRS